MRFKLELKYRQTKLVQNYLFANQLDIFEYELILKYFKYSEQLLGSNYYYTDWILDFQKQYWDVTAFCSLVTNYSENQIINNQEEEKKLFHLLQFSSFVKSLKLNPFKDWQKHKIKNQSYYKLKFTLTQFMTFTAM